MIATYLRFPKNIRLVYTNLYKENSSNSSNMLPIDLRVNR